MAAFSVVGLDPGCKSGGAFIVTGEDLAVGPFGGQGAVEAFDFAVLPRAVRLDESLFRAEVFARVFHGLRVAVGERVVGHDAFDAGDALGGEVRGGAFEERGARRALLVGQDFGVGQARVVVHEGVDVVVAHTGAFGLRCLCRGSSVGFPPATVGDLAEFLDVHVHEFAGVFTLVAACGLLGRADDVTADRVEVAQVGHVVA